ELRERHVPRLGEGQKFVHDRERIFRPTRGVDRTRGGVEETRASGTRLAGAVFAREEATRDWRPRNCRDAVGAAHREEFTLDAAIEEVVGRLLADNPVEAVAIGTPERF